MHQHIEDVCSRGGNGSTLIEAFGEKIRKCLNSPFVAKASLRPRIESVQL